MGAKTTSSLRHDRVLDRLLVSRHKGIRYMPGGKALFIYFSSCFFPLTLPPSPTPRKISLHQQAFMPGMNLIFRSTFGNALPGYQQCWSSATRRQLNHYMTPKSASSLLPRRRTELHWSGREGTSYNSMPALLSFNIGTRMADLDSEALASLKITVIFDVSSTMRDIRSSRTRPSPGLFCLPTSG